MGLSEPRSILGPVGHRVLGAGDARTGRTTVEPTMWTTSPFVQSHFPARHRQQLPRSLRMHRQWSGGSQSPQRPEEKHRFVSLRASGCGMCPNGKTCPAPSPGKAVPQGRADLVICKQAEQGC